jgi:hypothetical protein
VSLTRAGLPVRVEPTNRAVTTLELGDVGGFVTDDYLASRILTRPGAGASLNAAGRSLLALLFARPGEVPRW